MSNTYFSNHSSQSRFLAISSASTSTAASSSTPALQQTPNNPPLNSTNSVPGRARSTSKHFSTSVLVDAGEGRKVSGGVGDQEVEDGYGALLPSVHPLRNTWVFYFRQQRTPGNKILSYEEGIKRVAAFSSVESFWALATHLTPPSLLTPTTDYLLFHAAVARPVWEDPLNIKGGKWIIRLRKGVADRVWEALVCAVVGDAFSLGLSDEDPVADGDDDEHPDAPEICGCTISVRQSEDIISLWNRVDRPDTLRVREKIRDTLREVLGIPASTIMEYKSNNDSMQDKSSFRNSAIDRAGGGGPV
ncbi:translation initiation factor eIF 4e-like domain-containing protein [Mycena galopus ATCC 62051]|nr:translation initiation factor eIF 4e-like domain-containing protein [Mycena galopus ATCC 62051]